MYPEVNRLCRSRQKRHPRPVAEYDEIAGFGLVLQGASIRAPVQSAEARNDSRSLRLPRLDLFSDAVAAFRSREKHFLCRAVACLSVEARVLSLGVPFLQGKAPIVWPNAAWPCQVVRDPASIATIVSCLVAGHSHGAPIPYRAASVASRVAASPHSFVAFACRVAAGMSLFDR